MDKFVRLHLILSQELLTIWTVPFVPRVGDEIRMGEREFYKVTKVVWVMDEPENHYYRANIGIKRIKL